MPKYEPNPFRTYTPEDVKRLRGSYNIEYSLANMGAQKLWRLFNEQPYIRSLGCSDGTLAIQFVEAGLQALYASGWNLAVNGTQDMYPDLGIYSSDNMAKLVERLNNALLRRDMIECSEGGAKRDWLVPIVCDIEAGFGSIWNTHEVAKSVIKSGCASFHIEDQASSVGRRCGHVSNKVIVPTKTFVKHLISARLAADIANVPIVICARTDSLGANFITDDHDEIDHKFIDFDTRTEDGLYALKGDPMERCIARAKSYAPFADAIWYECSTPDLGQAIEFSVELHKSFPDKILYYNLSPSFNWNKHLSDKQIAEFQDRLAEYQYLYQFITLSSFHSNNFSAYKLASDYRDNGMSGYTRLQNEEFEWENKGYTAVKHQRFSGASYFDAVREIVDGHSDMSALANSTEAHQF